MGTEGHYVNSILANIDRVIHFLHDVFSSKFPPSSIVIFRFSPTSIVALRLWVINGGAKERFPLCITCFTSLARCVDSGGTKTIVWQICLNIRKIIIIDDHVDKFSFRTLILLEA